MSVLSSIIEDVSARLQDAASAAGFTQINVLRDDFAVLNFPPAPTEEWVAPKQMNFSIQLPEGELLSDQNVNLDKFRQHFKIFALYFTGTQFYQDAAAALVLSEKVELVRAETVKQLRGARLANVTRGGFADNTIAFSWERWAWGEGRGAGFTLEFDVIYRTLQNDPDTKG